MRQPIITVACEGGLFVPGRNVTAPIRIYHDRWVEDDIAALRTGRKKRQRLSRPEFRHIRRAAAENRRQGLV